MPIPDYTYKLNIQVRDYELDAEGIVNNAVYLNYMEYTRHEYCKQAGLSFGEMRSRDIVPVVSSMEISYKSPLKSDDEVVSCLNISRKGPLFVFEQDIYRTDGTPVTKAKVRIACIENGHLSKGETLAKAFNLTD